MNGALDATNVGRCGVLAGVGDRLRNPTRAELRVGQFEYIILDTEHKGPFCPVSGAWLLGRRPVQWSVSLHVNHCTNASQDLFWSTDLVVPPARSVEAKSNLDALWHMIVRLCFYNKLWLLRLLPRHHELVRRRHCDRCRWHNLRARQAQSHISHRWSISILEFTMHWSARTASSEPASESVLGGETSAYD